MRALAAPTSLKRVSSASAAADALARGLRAGGAEALAMPVADGGDGTLDVLGGDAREAEVSAPLDGRVQARWSLLDDGTRQSSSRRRRSASRRSRDWIHCMRRRAGSAS